MKKSSKPKLLDLITTLSQSNVELGTKNTKDKERERFEHLFPDIPTEELTMTTDEEAAKRAEKIQQSSTSKTLPQRKENSLGSGSIKRCFSNEIFQCNSS